MRRLGLIRSVAVGLTLAVLVFLDYRVGLLEVFELKALDWRFQARGPIAPEATIVLVSIDQDSFDELHIPWPWPRTVHAELLRRLSRGSPKLIGFDLLFPEPKPDPREDLALAQAIGEAGNVILAAEYTNIPTPFGSRQSLSLPIVQIRERALGFGLANLAIDRDGIVRRAALSISFQDRVYPSFAYRIYQALSAGKDSTPPPEPDSAVMINFRGPERTYPVVPYYRIVRGEIEPAQFRDKVVIVGAFAPSLHDQFSTPFGAARPTAGVEIQANLVETLMSGDAIRLLPGWVHAAAFFLLTGLTIVAAVGLKPLQTLVIFLAVSVIYSLANLYLFSRFQLWLPLVPGLIGAALSYGGVTLDGYLREHRERLRLRATFGKYVSPDVLEEILEDREGLGLTGKRRHITVLFSDIRGFTSISERISPEQVVSLLSRYLAQATEIIFKHGGTVDKFIGDAIMAIYGAPKSRGDDALRAVEAGLELIRLARSLGPDWVAATGQPLRIGVGINSGDAVVGSIGSEIRSDFTAIGDAVNLASRLESMTKEVGVPLLISEFAAKELNDAVRLKALGQVKVAGRETPVLVYTTEAVAQDGPSESGREPAGDRGPTV